MVGALAWGSPVDTDAELEFDKNGRKYRFYAHAAIRPSEMREAAWEFVRNPGAAPSAVAWVAEGVADDMIEGGESGP